MRRTPWSRPANPSALGLPDLLPPDAAVGVRRHGEAGDRGRDRPGLGQLPSSVRTTTGLGRRECRQPTPGNAQAGKANRRRKGRRPRGRGRHQAQQIVSLMDMVGDHGDVDLLLQLFAGLDGRIWAVSGPRAYPDYAVSVAFMKAIDGRAEAGSFADVARILEAFLDSNRRRKLAARALNGGVTSVPQEPIGSTQFYVGSYKRTLAMDFPGRAHIDGTTLTVLGDAFMLYEAPRFLATYSLSCMTASTERPRVIAHEQLILCGLRWWEDDRLESIAELTRAVEASPSDPALRLELARMHEFLQQPKEAITVIDAMPTPDHAAVQFRESAALRVAVRAGNLERVRLAAERLFPLRLDALTSAEIAGQIARSACTIKPLPSWTAPAHWPEARSRRFTPLWASSRPNTGLTTLLRSPTGSSASHIRRPPATVADSASILTRTSSGGPIA